MDILIHKNQFWVWDRKSPPKPVESRPVRGKVAEDISDVAPNFVKIAEKLHALGYTIHFEYGILEGEELSCRNVNKSWHYYYNCTGPHGPCTVERLVFYSGVVRLPTGERISCY